MKEYTIYIIYIPKDSASCEVITKEGVPEVFVTNAICEIIYDNLVGSAKLLGIHVIMEDQ